MILIDFWSLFGVFLDEKLIIFELLFRNSDFMKMSAPEWKINFWRFGDTTNRSGNGIENNIQFWIDCWWFFVCCCIDFWSMCWSLLVGPQSKYLNVPGYLSLRIIGDGKVSRTASWLHIAFQNRSKNHENVDPKRLPIMHPFSLRFWTPKTSLLGPNLEPSWPSVSLQDGPKGLPDPPSRGLPDRTWSQLASQSRLKTAQEASQTPPEASQVLRRSIFGGFLIDFLMDFWWPIWLPGGFSRDPERNFASGDFRKTPKSLLQTLFSWREGWDDDTTRQRQHWNTWNWSAPSSSHSGMKYLVRTSPDFDGYYWPP